MKSFVTVLKRALTISVPMTLALPLASNAGVIPPMYSERFGVVDITPTNLSGEASQNSEPSLGVVQTGPNYGKMVAHAFSGNYYYTSASYGGPPWTSPGTLGDVDGTLDWSTSGNCYLALMPTVSSFDVRQSSDPATVAFSTIAGGTVTGKPDQPWIKVVNVTNVDHIYVGFNDLSRRPGRTASVRSSVSGGATWTTTVIEKINPGTGWDSPAVRLAISSNGKTVYALFQRGNLWTGAAFGSDFQGDVVLVRDDAYGQAGYSALGSGGNGTLVANGAILPWAGGTSLGAQRLGSHCDVAINPSQPATVYVAYTDIVLGVPILRVRASSDSGVTFNQLYYITNASIPALAVAKDGTVGLLYATKRGSDLQVHFLKAWSGNFNNTTDRVLAEFPNNVPVRTFDPYIGDYFTLRAVGYNFFGTFCASGDPNPSHFPSGVFYQRNVNIGGTIKNNFWLNAPGILVNNSGQPILASIDPFVFYDIAPLLIRYPQIALVPRSLYDPGDPLSGLTHLNWPALPTNQPQFQLQSAYSLPYCPGPNCCGTCWAAETNHLTVQANGQLGVDISDPCPYPQKFFRLNRDVASSQFQLFAAAGAHGALSPSGVLTTAGTMKQTFTATPTNGYYAKWCLDGELIQMGGTSLTVSNIADEHSLTVAFLPSNDLAVTVAELPLDDGPTVVNNTNQYVIDIENKGLTPLTGIMMTNLLPASANFVAATTSQGTVANSGSSVTANVGSLNPGGLATVTVWFVPITSGSISQLVHVVCNQFEPDMSNNTATDITTVIDPLVITNHPASQTVPPGGTATFSAGVSGTGPFQYQWKFNGTNIAGWTCEPFIITNVTPAQAGIYSVTVYQVQGPEDILEADSLPATLNVMTFSDIKAVPRGSNNTRVQGRVRIR